MKGKFAGLGLPVLGAGVVGASLFFGANSVTEGSGHAGPPPGQAIPTQVLGVTLTAASVCPANAFCISGDVTNVGPTSPQNLTLTLSNPNSFPIYVTRLTVAAGDVNTPNGSCPGSLTIFSPGWTSSEPFVPSNGTLPTDAIPLAAATSSGYGTATVTASVAFDASSTTVNQTPCLNAKVPLTYGGNAYWYGNCISGSQNGSLTVSPGAVDCVSSTGKVTGGITIPSGSGLVLMGGATVTGGIKASSGASEFLLCGANVTGGITVSGAAGPVIIGSGNYCRPNSITGGVALTNNTGGIEVAGNTITGGLTVTGNSGSVPASQGGKQPVSAGFQYVGGNNIFGGITCSPTNTPGLSDGGNINTIKGPRTGAQCQGSF